ncbi:MAG: DUF4959 domain-containing protein [Prevotella sp.]|jgi:hypothetical protein|nr:DUF4959 domain-containing protein [Prevotella sp.]
MKTKISIFLIFLFILYSCGEDSILKPYGENDGVPPGAVTIESYEQIPGGAVLRYKAPKDEDLLYVKAEYTLDNGMKREMKSSVYSDSLKIEGFGDTEEKSVILTAVDRNENIGEPVEIKIIPGEQSLYKSFRTISSDATWGGVRFKIENKDKGNFIIDVMTQDTEGEWYVAHTEYTKSASIEFAVRGFDTTPRDFKLSMRDQWDNKTDDYAINVSPLYEVELDRSKFRKYYLGNDTGVDEWGFSMERIWNGQNWWGAFNMCHSANFSDFPVWFTFDLGVMAKLSRFHYWQRLDDLIYQNGNVNKFELWGHSGSPSLDGNWDGWIKLIECEDFKPSGLPAGINNSEDIDHAVKGLEFDFDVSLSPVRYIRFKALSTFTSAKTIHFQQIWFWGQVIG